MPSYDTVTVWHMRDLLSGTRKMIKGTDVKHYNVPQYEGLKIEAFYQFAAQFPEVMMAFPTEQQERDKMPRQYIINIIHTMRP